MSGFRERDMLYIQESKAGKCPVFFANVRFFYLLPDRKFGRTDHQEDSLRHSVSQSQIQQKTQENRLLKQPGSSSGLFCCFYCNDILCVSGELLSISICRMYKSSGRWLKYKVPPMEAICPEAINALVLRLYSRQVNDCLVVEKLGSNKTVTVLLSI